MLQPIEEMSFNSNSTERYKNNFRYETELKWIKSLQTPFPLGFNENIYHQGNISKMPDFDVFSLLDILRRIGDPVVNVKMVIRNVSTRTKLFGHLKIYGRS